MFTLAELYLKFSNNLRMLSNIQNSKIPKFQQIWIKTTIMFVTAKYCEDWVINTVFKVSIQRTAIFQTYGIKPNFNDMLKARAKRL